MPSLQKRPHVNRLPVLLLRHGLVSIRGLEALFDDSRLELLVADQLTPEWVSLAQRVAGTIVATEADPIEALFYAVSSGIKGPVIVLHSSSNRADRKELVIAGAADCLTIPITRKSLDRVIPILASNASLSRVDETLGIVLDPITLSVRAQGKCVRLTQREFAVLQCMSSYHGRPVAAYKLVAYVWGERASVDRSRNILDVYIFQLRKKLERLGLSGAIATVRGLGYALVHVTPEQTAS